MTQIEKIEREIDELEENKKKNPKRKIDEPKTPYVYYVIQINIGSRCFIR